MHSFLLNTGTYIETERNVSYAAGNTTPTQHDCTTDTQPPSPSALTSSVPLPSSVRQKPAVKPRRKSTCAATNTRIHTDGEASDPSNDGQGIYIMQCSSVD